MKFYVPEIGDKLKLTKDWSFDLHAEDRNATLGLLEGYTVKFDWGKSPTNHIWISNNGNKSFSIPITLPAGTILKVDRIYIRKGLKEFSSITFLAPTLGSVQTTNRWSKTSVKRGIRFWVKLSDANNIEFEN